MAILDESMAISLVMESSRAAQAILIDSKGFSAGIVALGNESTRLTAAILLAAQVPPDPALPVQPSLRRLRTSPEYMTQPFTAPTPWSPDRPHTLVVCCSDGRWHAQVVEFMQAEVSRYADLYAIPGGPAVLDPWNSSYDEFRAFEQGMRLLSKYHDLSSIWLVAHEGCAFYMEKHPHFDDGARRARQVADLARGRAAILERYPTLEVLLIYASLRGDRTVFEHCLDSVKEERR
jgi:hypothetical protein